MSEMLKRLPMLIEMRKKHLNQLRANQSDPVKDKNGSASMSLAGTLRFLGVAEYVHSKNVEAFRVNLAQAASLSKKLFERFEAGDAISPSYVSMLAYKNLFDALAADDQQLAKELAGYMGSRDEIERGYDHPFDMAFGYVLKSFVLNESDGMKKWLSEFKALCDQSEDTDFKGYVQVFNALMSHDAKKASSGFTEILEGHKRQSKAGGVFKDTEDEMLCVWGIGLANLSRMRGISVKFQDQLIPADLLI